MKYRNLILIPGLFVLFTLAYTTSVLLHQQFKLLPGTSEFIQNSLGWVLACHLLVLLALGELRRTYRYVTLKDGLIACGGTTLSTILLCGLSLVPSIRVSLPISLIVTHWMISTGMYGAGRVSYRLGTEIWASLTHTQKHPSPRRELTLVYTTDPHAIKIGRALLTENSRYKLRGFIATASRSSLLLGAPVWSLEDGLKSLLERTRAKHILIPSSVPGKSVRKIHATAFGLGVHTHIVPAVEDLVDGRIRIKMREVAIEDLLQREPNRIDMRSIHGLLEQRRVLVTGGAGSIGSELSRQIYHAGPERLMILDNCEFNLFRLEAEIREQFGSTEGIEFVVGDVTNSVTMQRVMRKFRPEILFHAAAYKHVPMMEFAPHEAIMNNVFGTRHLADLAHEFQVKRFVLVSTDKAVNPSNVMGATKLLAEKYLQGRATQSSTEFLTIRFGNVLNSAGSVIPTFRRQIQNGGPITVTHPKIERFFMTIPEAVQLTLQAGALGRSREILILDMGQPVKIFDLAKDMIALSGLRYPDDIDIVFTGLRPGEKMYEELFYDTELEGRQVHEKISCALPGIIPLMQIQRDLQTLKSALNQEEDELLQVFWQIVEQYTSEALATGERRAAA